MEYKHIYCEWDKDGETFYPSNKNILIRTCVFCNQMAPIAVKQICPKKPFLLGNLIGEFLKSFGITDKRIERIIGRKCRCKRHRFVLNLKHQHYKVLRYEEKEGRLYSFWFCFRQHPALLNKLYYRRHPEEHLKLKPGPQMTLYSIPTNPGQPCPKCGKVIKARKV